MAGAWQRRGSHGGLLLAQREADALLAAGAARHGHGVLVPRLLQARPQRVVDACCKYNIVIHRCFWTEIFWFDVILKE